MESRDRHGVTNAPSSAPSKPSGRLSFRRSRTTFGTIFRVLWGFTYSIPLKALGDHCLIHTRSSSKALLKPSESSLITSTFRLTKWKISMARGIRKPFPDWQLSKTSSVNWQTIIGCTMLVQLLRTPSFPLFSILFRMPEPQKYLPGKTFPSFLHIHWNRRIIESPSDTDKAKPPKEQVSE